MRSHPHYTKENGYLHIVAFELNSRDNTPLGEPEHLPADSFLISYCNGGETFHTLLDTGKKGQGKRVIVPYLQERGIGTLDMVIVSHPHQDHFGGLIDILEHSLIEVKQIVYAPVAEEDVRRGDPDRQNADNWKRLEGLLQQNKHLCRELSKADVGRELRIDNELYWTIIDAPLERQPPDEKLNLNNLNLVLKLNFREFTALFPGDCAIKQSGDLLHSPYAGHLADLFLLKAAHHGGNQSLTPELIGLCNPRVVIIPCNDFITGKAAFSDNFHQYSKNGAKVFRTDVYTTIELATDGHHVTCTAASPHYRETVVFECCVC